MPHTPTSFFFFSEGMGWVCRKRECLPVPVLVSLIHSADQHGLNAKNMCQALSLMLGEKEKSVRHVPCLQRASSPGGAQNGWGCNQLHQPRCVPCHLGRTGLKGSRSLFPYCSPGDSGGGREPGVTGGWEGLGVLHGGGKTSKNGKEVSLTYLTPGGFWSDSWRRQLEAEGSIPSLRFHARVGLAELELQTRALEKALP